MAVAQTKLEGLQKRLDEKLINPKDLNTQQKVALDKALKSGKLKGYKGGVAEMYAERNLARKTVAADVRAKLAPLTPSSTFSLGIKRGTMVAAGDIIGSFTPYIMDGKKLAFEARKAALMGRSVSYKPSLVAGSAKNAFRGFTNVLTKLPVFKNLKLFKNTAKLLDGFGNLIGKGGNAGAMAAGVVTSQALRTELKSQAYGALGAGAGSIAYDTVNFPAKLAVGMGEDLAGIDQNKYAQMNPVARTAYHAVDNARTALLWNAGAFGLFGMGRGAWHFLGKKMKVDPITQRKINEQILDQGVPLNITHYVEGTEGLSSLVKGINEITSVLPVAAGVPKIQRAKFTAAAMMQLNSNLKNALNVPLLHGEVLANALNSTVKKTYDEAGSVFGALYKGQEEKLNGISDLFARYVDEIAARRGVIMGKPVGTTLPATGKEEILTNIGIKGGMDIPWISTENLRATTARMVEDIRKTIPAGTEARMAQAGLRSGTMDPVNGFIKEIQDRLRQFEVINGDRYITPGQYNQMRRDWNDNYVKTFAKSADPVQAKVLQVLEAFEKDFSNVVKAPNQSAALAGNVKLAKMYNGIKAELGAAKADEFYNTFRKELTTANQDYIDANYMFGQVQNFYNHSKLAAIVRQMDASELTAKQALNITGKNNINNVQGMNKLFKAAFDPKWGNADGVEELYQLLGGAKYFGKNPVTQKRAAYTMKLLMYRQFFDAFNQNAIVRKTGAVEVSMKPFTTEGADLATTIEMLNAKSPHFRDTTEEILKKGMPSGDVSPALVNKIAAQKAAIDVDLVRKAIEDGIPLESRVLITKELQAAQKQADNIIASRTTQGLPVKPRQEIINELVKPIDMDVVGKRKILATGLEKGKVIEEATRQRLTKELDTLNLRLGAYEEFKFKNFQKALGLGTDEGRAQLIKGFELGQGMSKGAAKTHVDNLETIIAALERNAQAPIGDSSKFILRRVILGLGLGGTIGVGAMFGGPGLLAMAMGAVMLRGGAHFFNSPAMAKKWLDLYTVAERLNINQLQTMLPTRQAVFADVFNYAFADDPDRPIVAPGNIPEEKIIKYLQEQETVQSVPTADGLYNTTPDETKMRFDPDLRKLRDLNKDQFVEVEGFNRGMRIANERTEMLDDAENNPQLQQGLTPQARKFIENPQVEEGMNLAQGVQPSQQSASMYKAMFPGDSLGAAIAEKRAAENDFRTRPNG